MKLSDLRKHIQIAPGEDPDNIDVQEAFRDFLSGTGQDPEKLYQELEMDSRFVDTRRDASPSAAPVQLHSHGFYELIFCRTNCGVEYLLGTERYRLMRGDIVFVSPGVSHRPIFPKDMTEVYRRYVLWISPEFMERFFELLPSSQSARLSGSGVVRTAGTQWSNLRELFQKGVLESEQRALGWEGTVYGNTMVLLSQLERAISDSSAPFMEAEKPVLIDSVIAYIETHLDQRLTLAEVAEKFYVSESTISHLFRNMMDTSFHRLVTQRRLVAAKGLIVRGISLEEVAARTGFGDYSTFYRAFRSEYGITPRQFRSMREDILPTG